MDPSASMIDFNPLWPPSLPLRRMRSRAERQIDVVAHDARCFHRDLVVTRRAARRSRPTRSCRYAAWRGSRRTPAAASSRASNFVRHAEAAWRCASASTTRKPTLCLVRTYERPGLPRPTTEARSGRACVRWTYPRYDSSTSSSGFFSPTSSGSPAPRPPRPATSSSAFDGASTRAARYRLVLTMVTPSRHLRSRGRGCCRRSSSFADVDLDLLGDLAGQRFDLDLTQHDVEHAAFLDAGRGADRDDRRRCASTASFRLTA